MTAIGATGAPVGWAQARLVLGRRPLPRLVDCGARRAGSGGRVSARSRTRNRHGSRATRRSPLGGRAARAGGRFPSWRYRAQPPRCAAPHLPPPVQNHGVRCDLSAAGRGRRDAHLAAEDQQGDPGAQISRNIYTIYIIYTIYTICTICTIYTIYTIYNIYSWPRPTSGTRASCCLTRPRAT